MTTEAPARIPPSDIGAEQAALGAAILDPIAREMVLARLEDHDLYTEAHRVVLRAIRALHEAGSGVDLVILDSALREAGDLQLAGGPAGTALLLENAGIPAGVPRYIDLILQASGKRHQIQVLEMALEHAWNGADPAALAQEAADHLAKIAERTDGEKAQERGAQRASFVSIGAVLDETVLDLHFGVPDLLPCPIQEVNDLFGGGFERGEFVVLGGGPGVAKSALAIEWARYVAEPERGGQRVGIISVEMGNRDVGKRMLAQAAMVSATNLRSYRVDDAEWTRIDRIVPRLSTYPILLCDAAVTISQVKRLVREAARHEQDLRLLIVDYMQLLQGPSEYASDRRLEVRSISRTLKLLAKRYNMTVLALSSLTPSPTEKGKPQRPSMRNLRETRDIDHDADTILLLWRPDPEKNERELIVDKGRGGATGRCTLQFTPWYLTFQETL